MDPPKQYMSYPMEAHPPSHSPGGGVPVVGCNVHSSFAGLNIPMVVASIAGPHPLHKQCSPLAAVVNAPTQAGGSTGASIVCRSEQGMKQCTHVLYHCVTITPTSETRDGYYGLCSSTHNCDQELNFILLTMPNFCLDHFLWEDLPHPQLSFLVDCLAHKLTD